MHAPLRELPNGLCLGEGRVGTTVHVMVRVRVKVRVRIRFTTILTSPSALAMRALADDHTVRVWDPAEGALLRVLGTPAQQTASQPEGPSPAGGANEGGLGGMGGQGEGEMADLTGVEFEPGEFQPGGGVVDNDGSEGPNPLGTAHWAYTGDLPGHADHVLCLTTHPTRPHLAASGGKDSFVVLWDVERGSAARRIPLGRTPLDVAFGCGASEGVVTIGLDVPNEMANSRSKVCVFDVETGAPRLAIEDGMIRSAKPSMVRLAAPNVRC
ncbi:MAG: hypothetical protein SGPRY_006933 [Prymnesium sp.]